MTDKYEEFKKWFIESDWVNCEVIIKKLPTNGGNAHLIYPNKKSIFENFEKEQSKKEKGKEIKDTIEQALHEEHCCFDGTRLYANAIYNKLKEKDLIK